MQPRDFDTMPLVNASPDRPLGVRAQGLTDRGRVRPDNEDQFAIAELGRALRVTQSSLGPELRFSDAHATLLVVADGMGGHRAGEVASSLAVSAVESSVLESLRTSAGLDSDEILERLCAAVRDADQRIFEQASQRADQRGMGTTLTVAYAVRSMLFVAHVGDSRLYLHRGGRLHQITRDHTLVTEMVERGALAPQMATSHPLRHVITNAVGGAEPGLKVEPHQLPLEPGDVVLLCSDGLTEMVPDQQIAEMLERHREPSAASSQLVAAALGAGGRDNVTAVVARFDALELDDR